MERKFAIRNSLSALRAPLSSRPEVVKPSSAVPLNQVAQRIHSTHSCFKMQNIDSLVEFMEPAQDLEAVHQRCGETSHYIVGKEIKSLKRVWYFIPSSISQHTSFFPSLGAEAVALLNSEALRRDDGSQEFLMTWQSLVNSLGTVFERMPKYAWIMKQVSRFISLFSMQQLQFTCLYSFSSLKDRSPFALLGWTIPESVA